MNNVLTKPLSRLSRKLQHPQELTKKVLALPLSVFRPGNIAMFHIGRSGSTVLADLLEQHPKITWDGELYQRFLEYWKKQEVAIEAGEVTVNPAKLVRQRMIWAGNKFYGFEVKFYHLKRANVNLSDYIEQLHRLGFSHFIVLERRNYLRKIVSSIIAADISRRYHQQSHEQAILNRIEIDLDNTKVDDYIKPLIAHLQDFDENFRKLEELLENRRVLRLTYEEDISAAPLEGYRRICDFLGIDYRPGSIRYSKTNPFKLSEIIINFEEVEHALRGTRFEWMLYE